MKILFFSEYFGAPTTTFIHNLVNEVVKLHDVRYLCCDLKTEHYQENYTEKLRYRQNPVTKKIFWWLEKYNIMLSHYDSECRIDTSRFLAQFNPEIIHGHFGNEFLILYDNLPHHIRINTPILVSFHGYDASMMLSSKVYVQRLKELSQQENIYFTFCTKALKSNLIAKEIVLNESRTFIVPYGIDTEYFKPENERENTQNIFLQVSSFSEKKGHIFTLNAYRRLIDRKPDLQTKLVLAGDGVLLDSIKQLTQDLKLENYVEFVGSVNPEQAKILMQNASFFLHHSITTSSGDTEGLPNAIIEAMAMELPVVSTYHSGIPELIEHDVNGLLVNEKNIEEYTDALCKILTWNYLPKNRQKVLQIYSLPTYTQNILSIYENIKKTIEQHV